MRTITLQMKDELHTQLFAAAERLDRPASGYVRDAIREKLAREAEPKPSASVTNINRTEKAAA